MKKSKTRIFLPKKFNFIEKYQISDLDFCDQLISFFEMNAVNHIDGTVSYRVDKSVKDSTDLPMQRGEPMCERYLSLLDPLVKQYTEKYYFSGYYDPWGSGTVNLQRYLPSQGFHAWHSERTTAAEPCGSRHLVFMTYLNDVDDDGETEFFHQRLKIKPKKGLTVIWPADWTFTHRGIPSRTQTKYIATGWFNYV